MPTYVFPETAVTALEAMTRYAKLEERVYDDVIEKVDDVDKDAVKAIFDKVVADGRDTLLGSEAYAVAEAYGISAAPIKLSTSADEAAELAEEMEFPVVLKIASDKILHKSDIGGVKVGIENADEAKAAYDEIIANAKAAHPDIIPDGVEVQKMMDSGEEVIVGMIKDKQFGPMIAFGMGGIYVNLIEDVAFNLAKGMSSQEIDEQIEKTKVSKLLEGYRGEAPCDIEEVKEAIKRMTSLKAEVERGEKSAEDLQAAVDERIPGAIHRSDGHLYGRLPAP